MTHGMGEAKRLANTIVVVTGGTRGIGKAIALAAAAQGATLVITYRDPAKRARAEETLHEIVAAGGEGIVERADITANDDMDALLATLKERYGRIDALILNAAGGLESDKSAEYADQVNRQAQISLVMKAAPLMPAGSWAVYLTSLWAHKHGELEPLPGYAPIAATKYRAEQDLRAMIPMLAEDGIRLGIVVGHLITGTGAYTVFKRKTRGAIDLLVETIEGGAFPTPDDVAAATLRFIGSDEPSGHTVFVGKPKE